MFNGIWLVATEPLTIKNREVQVGERFEISRVQSGALLVTGRAVIAESQVTPREPIPPAPRRRGRPRKTADPAVTMEPETPDTIAPIDVDADLSVPKRRYRRRDLEAEA